MTAPTFIRWLGAVAIIGLGIALLEAWDTKVAWTAAVLILLAAFFRYPAAMSKIRDIVNGVTP